MKCAYCSVEVYPVPLWQGYYSDAGEKCMAQGLRCPGCDRVSIRVAKGEYADPIGRQFHKIDEGVVVVWPRVSSRPPIAPEVPEPYASLAREAGLIINDSPRASAALSRRCLQQLLRDVAKAPPDTLFKEIEWVLANGDLPSHAKDSLHDLRKIGNMATHPNKSTATGDYLEVEEVEPGEADWTLDVLDALFDHYFVGPARTAARKASLDAKLGRGPEP